MLTLFQWGRMPTTPSAASGLAEIKRHHSKSQKQPAATNCAAALSCQQKEMPQKAPRPPNTQSVEKIRAFVQLARTLPAGSPPEADAAAAKK
jgi:hypothetical protein